MAALVIKDLAYRTELDRQAMAGLKGGVFINWSGLFANYESLLSAKRRSASGIINNIFNFNRSPLNIQYVPQTVVGAEGPTVAISAPQSQTANVMTEVAVGADSSPHGPCCCEHH